MSDTKKHTNTNVEKKNYSKKIEKENLKLKDTIKKLENEKKELEEMAKRAQIDYLNLKSDFDILSKQVAQKEKNMKSELTITIIKKIIPIISEMKKSLWNISDDMKKNPIIQWLELMYNKFLNILSWLNVFPIVSIWEIPDSNFHEPVSMENIDDKNLKWKIIKEFESGFFYEEDWQKKTITTSKVVIWQ